MSAKFVGYYRVSTAAQGYSGLGLEAQQQAVNRHVTQCGGQLCAEFTEIESGRREDRPKLQEAIRASKRLKARLIVAKFDRLARNARFLLTLRDSGCDFLAADMPNANKLTVALLAVVAEHERDQISQRTKEALDQAKLRGIRLGNPRIELARPKATNSLKTKANAYAANLLPVIKEIQQAGISSLRGIATILNTRGFTAPRGGALSAKTVSNLLARRSYAQTPYLAGPSS